MSSGDGSERGGAGGEGEGELSRPNNGFGCTKCQNFHTFMYDVKQNLEHQSHLSTLFICIEANMTLPPFSMSLTTSTFTPAVKSSKEHHS